jgi:hypothetical protein
MRLTILGQPWKLLVLSERQFKARYPEEGLEGFTEGPPARLMVFNEANLSPALVTHEMVHAYCFELPIGTMNLGQADSEEFFAEFMAMYGSNLIKKANETYSDLIRRRKK